MPPRRASRAGPTQTANGPNGFHNHVDPIQTVGVRRPNFGIAGRNMKVNVNSFETTIPEKNIHHYDAMVPSEQTLPQRLNMDLINRLQTTVAPEIFTPRAVYDGRKNMFSADELNLPFGDDGIRSAEFDVSLSGENSDAHRTPKIYRIRIAKVAEINPEVLKGFIQGSQSHDNSVTTALTALNIVIRMAPIMRYPFNARSFFTEQESRSIGAGLVVWRGYFQSVRPGINKLFINVDITTGMMYKSGPLIALALEFLGKRDPGVLFAKNFDPRERLRFQRFVVSMRIITRRPSTTTAAPRTVKKITQGSARSLVFTVDGAPISVADYFARQNQNLQFPDMVCVEVGSGALIPMELCDVPRGQLIRKQIPPEKTKDVLSFATMKPAARLQSITRGLEVLAYGQSEYVRQFGMNVNTEGPLQLEARVLIPPKLRYGGNQMIQPHNGSWNMMDKKLWKPMKIEQWALIIYEYSNRFSVETGMQMAQNLVKGCKAAGMIFTHPEPVISHENGQKIISQHLKAAGRACKERYGGLPTILVIILPEVSNDIYTAVKYFGDCETGVATQCLKYSKCWPGNPQYWANVALKINTKLGGINVIADPSSVTSLIDPAVPTIVMGADVIHPAPGAEGRPSFTAVVGNVDSNAAKYIAVNAVQASRQEIISDLGSMAKKILEKWRLYQNNVEKKTKPLGRIIFYRDGVSEGQFQQVLDLELPALQQACKELDIKPKITMIVVGKRHHVRLFPINKGDGDAKSGNCPAGTIIDTGITHPTQFDFYLQSHGGILGTSRSAHYSVLYDENKFSADNLQSLSFALCHVYARSCRSISIPAPVYYADIVCSRSRNHYNPTMNRKLDQASSVDSASQNDTLKEYRENYTKLHVGQENRMYFS